MMIDRKAITIKRALKKKKPRIVKKFKQRRIRSITIHGTEKSNIAIKIKKIALQDIGIYNFWDTYLIDIVSAVIE